ncbi:hypothetical protein ACL7TT_17190 [Microbulbifer sp. 2304DJ12-6]|uniref:hypothetical protein n=1 Tax=Microbulbifer sp. 2304DJ12-6 TaxID=3233340 RepID=UPI0039B0688A
MNLNEQQLEALMRKVARESARETGQDLLEKLGVDTEDVRETQKDFAHLRAQRKASEQVTVWGKRILLGIFLSGVGGTLWAGFKVALSVKS